MVERRRKKSVRYRGSKTHGCGSMKKRRGAGNRGGRGNAGSGKRSDAKKPSVWKVNAGGKDPSKRGFHSVETRPDTINVGHLSSIAHTLVSGGKATQQSGTTTLDLASIGVQKLLGAGRVGSRLSLTVAIATPKAKEKIEAAGGSLTAGMLVDKESVVSAREAKAKAGREDRMKGKKGKGQAAEQPAKAKAAAVAAE